jgi:hypothetical protein
MVELGGGPALVPIYEGTVTNMPKWVVYREECNCPSIYVEIDSATMDLTAPKAKKPLLPMEGDRWACPRCKSESRVRECDLTYSYA